MHEAHSADFAERRAAVLSELVLVFAQGRDPVVLAEEAVHLVARATDTAAVFVYLWDDEEERLVLRVATPALHELGGGDVRLRLGEGIAGWTALRLQSVIIRHAPHEDPRYVEIDQIEEHGFNSMLAVPIADQHSQLLGVFALYSREVDAFGEDELAIAVEVGRLLASGLMRAETNEDLKRQSASARFLVDFPSSSMSSLLSALQHAARRILDLVDAQACSLDYLSRREGGTTPIVFALRTGDSADHRVWSSHSRVTSQATIEQHCAGMEAISVVLGMGSSRGVLTCYGRRKYRSRDLDRLSAIAAQLGVLLEAIDLNTVNSSVAARLVFSADDDQSARLVTELGVKQPFCPAMLRVLATRCDWETAARLLRDALATAAGPRSVVLVDSALCVVLADAPGGRIPSKLPQQLTTALRRLNESIGLRAAIGFGTVSHRRDQTRASVANAQVALHWAETIDRDQPVPLAVFSEISEVVSLPDVVRGVALSAATLIRTLEPLVRYDVEQNAQLVRTLSVLAACGGSVNDTAVELVIHRNTLRQRTQRIEQLLSTSLTASMDWPALAVAARVADARVNQLRADGHR